MRMRILGLLAIGLLAGPMAAHAVPITYTWTGTGNGTLGSNAFSDARFVLSVSSDTDAVFSPATGIFRAPAAPATVAVTRLGSGTLTDVIGVVANNNTSAVGISDFTLKLAILFVENDAVATYDLSSAFGLISGSAIFNAGKLFPTSAGDFSLTSVSNPTFRAVVRSVPEPGTLALLLTGLAGIGLSRKRLAA